jgi:hypothetical protein
MQLTLEEMILGQKLKGLGRYVQLDFATARCTASHIAHDCHSKYGVYGIPDISGHDL